MKSLYQIEHEYRASRNQSLRRRYEARNVFVRPRDFLIAAICVAPIVVFLDVLRMLTS